MPRHGGDAAYRDSGGLNEAFFPASDDVMAHRASADNRRAVSDTVTTMSCCAACCTYGRSKVTSLPCIKTGAMGGCCTGTAAVVGGLVVIGIVILKPDAFIAPIRTVPVDLLFTGDGGHVRSGW